MIPGAVSRLPATAIVVINAGREVTGWTVVNTGDRPIQVGSHYHFAEANPALSFDRGRGHGQRLDVPAGTAVRFEPGGPQTSSSCRSAGSRGGFRGRWVRPGPIGRPSMTSTARRVRRAVRARRPATGSGSPTPTCSIEVTEDRCRGAGGDEAVFGGGKVIRESMGQPAPPAPRARPTWSSPARWSSTTGASSRPTSASATADRRASARPATPTPWTASTPTW